MMVATETPTMAKKKKKAEIVETATVRIASDVLADCKMAAMLKGKSLPAYISSVLAPVAKRDADHFRAAQQASEKDSN
jgi:hypothetical protein